MKKMFFYFFIILFSYSASAQQQKCDLTQLVNLFLTAHPSIEEKTKEEMKLKIEKIKSESESEPIFTAFSSVNSDLAANYMTRVSVWNFVREYLVKDFFNDLKNGTWGNEQKNIISCSLKKPLANLYIKTIDDALKYTGTPLEKLQNLFEKIYPAFIENPLVKANNYEELENNGQDVLDALATGIYGNFESSTNLMEAGKAVSTMAIMIGLRSEEYAYTHRAYISLRLTYLALGLPSDPQDWRNFNDWHSKSDNAKKTYTDYKYAEWSKENPGKGIDAFAAKQWAEIVHPAQKLPNGEIVKLTDDAEIESCYKSIKHRRESKGL